VVTGAGRSPQSNVEGCHRPGCENDVSKRERKTVTFLQGVSHGAPDERLPAEWGVLKIEQPFVVQRFGNGRSGSALSSRVRVRIGKVREPVSEATRPSANTLEALQRL
jgi:hypothetical protein